MRSRLRRIAMGVGLVAGGGVLLASPSSGCISFQGEALFAMTDFCFIFDCTNGVLGGTIDPCGAGFGIFGDLENTDPLLLDCPEE